LIKNRVEFQERIEDSVERIPFLKRFFIKGELLTSAIGRMNAYMGVAFMESLESAKVNELLEEAERRGDL